jgi:hypothetical protein
MLALDLLAERRIAEAIARGELDDLPGAGQPLALDDAALVPEELRAAYRMLKNAGFVPPEVESLRELRELERLVDSSPDAEARRRALLRLDLIRAQLEQASFRRGPSALPEYRQALLARLERP